MELNVNPVETTIYPGHQEEAVKNERFVGECLKRYIQLQMLIYRLYFSLHILRQRRYEKKRRPEDVRFSPNHIRWRNYRQLWLML